MLFLIGRHFEYLAEKNTIHVVVDGANEKLFEFRLKLIILDKSLISGGVKLLSLLSARVNNFYCGAGHRHNGLICWPKITIR